MLGAAHLAGLIRCGDAEGEEASLRFDEFRPGGHRVAHRGGGGVAEREGNADGRR